MEEGAEEGDEPFAGSSENTGTGRSENGEEGSIDEDGDISRSKSMKKRKKYHRHTTEQIKEMEA